MGRLRNKAVLSDQRKAGNITFGGFWMSKISKDPELFYNSSEYRKIKNRKRKNIKRK